MRQMLLLHYATHDFQKLKTTKQEATSWPSGGLRDQTGPPHPNPQWQLAARAPGRQCYHALQALGWARSVEVPPLHAKQNRLRDK